jgi:hypothetical protein
MLVNSSLTYKITLGCSTVWMYSAATCAVLEDTRHMGNATYPDFTAWPQNLKMVKKSRMSTENKKQGGKGHLLHIATV